MYRNTRFAELLKGLNRGAFAKVVDSHEADKHSKGFRSWDQLVAMLYAQISGCRSLRELEAGFNSQRLHHYHLGSRDIRRSTLAEANSKRDSAVFADLCGELLQKAHRKARRELKDLLYLLDSTPIPLKGLGYDSWTKHNHNYRTQGLKVHMTFVPGPGLPVQADITPANVNDVEMGREIPLESGSTYVFDKGYCDYDWWYKIHKQKAFFVTRLKKNAGVEYVQSLPVDEAAQDIILEDAVILFKHRQHSKTRVNHYHGNSLRQVIVKRPNHDNPLILVTNDMKRSAVEIAELYRERWGIELFFKWLKQNLKIKQFLGRNENAVKTQIYTALISYLLVQIYQWRNGAVTTLKMCLAELRNGLFQRAELERELYKRRHEHRKEYQELQGALAL